MLKYIQTDYGDVSKSIALIDAPISEPQNSELQIELFAAALNPIDFKIIHGALKPIMKTNFPAPMGFDGSGVITKIGPNVSQFKIGDEVFFRAELKSRGAFAQFINIKSELVAMKPKNMTHFEAASLPLVGLTTMQGILNRAKAKSGQSILIHAGSGGVGSFAIQYAKALGLIVTTTTSSKNAQLVKDLGADFVIEYDNEDYLSKHETYDIVYDTLGGDFTFDAFKIIKPNGSIISIAGPPTIEMARQLNLNMFLSMVMRFLSRKVTKAAKQKNCNYFGYFTQSDGAQLREIANLVEDNKIKALIDEIFPFENLVQAMEKLETGRAKGKVILKIKA